jgi:hypothetical protein
MAYDTDKLDVLKFFDDHILKYIVTDLEVLNSIEADSNGIGGCAIPQAVSTFSALDLLGYLIHPQDLKTVGMSFTDLLKNQTLFPEFRRFTAHIDFFNSFRDDVRSIMTHRFSLTKYAIAKVKMADLFFENSGVTVFNVCRFTEMAIEGIHKVYDDLQRDSFIINGYTKIESVKKIKDRIEKLKLFESDDFIGPSNLNSTSTTQTTNPLG